MLRICLATVVVFFFTATFTLVSGAERHLFLAAQNGKSGFIDSTGTFVIKPQFQSANEFSDGLAAVRVGGRYGFIDESGAIVIEPRFDYATVFQEGLALVLEDGKPFFIDRAGKKAFDNHFTHVGAFTNGRAKVATGMHEGYLDKTGRLIIDTVYYRIGPFKNGLAVVYDHWKNISSGNGLIDSNGKLIVPYGKYNNMAVLSNGYSYGINILHDSANKHAMARRYTGLDRKGNVAFILDDSMQVYRMGDFSNGLAAVQFRTNNFSSHVGFVDTNGRMVMAFTDQMFATDFSKKGHFYGTMHNVFR